MFLTLAVVFALIALGLVGAAGDLLAHRHESGAVGGSVLALAISAGTFYTALIFYRAWIRARGVVVSQARKRSFRRTAVACVIGGVVLVAAPTPGLSGGARGVFAVVVGLGLLIGIAAEADSPKIREESGVDVSHAEGSSPRAATTLSGDADAD